MRTIGLLMAGGRGERMFASGGLFPKPLVEVGGVTLLERNLHQLLRAGLTEIVVSTPVDQPDVKRLTTTRGMALARALGARLSVLEEERPLGNAGCASRLRGRADSVLMVYSDVLTTLSLGGILRHHAENRPALTLAVHREPLRIPYGELEVVDDEVVDYREKPERHTPICSGISVLDSTALELLPDDRPTGLVDLFHSLRSNGYRVGAFPHQAPWIDVNDIASAKAAEALVRAHPEEFECWLDRPHAEVICPIVRGPAGLLLRQSGRQNGKAPPRSLPRVSGVSGRSLEQSLTDAVGGLPLALSDRSPLLEFDDLDEESGLVARFRIFDCRRAPDARHSPPDGFTWASGGAGTVVEEASPVLKRVLALVESEEHGHSLRRAATTASLAISRS